VNFPIAPRLHHDGWTRPFDIVTNFGFSEHVTDQEAFWRNHHDLCRPGGIMSGVTPAPEFGHWPHHGILQPTVEFYRTLAEANGYTQLRLWQKQPAAEYPHPDPGFVWDDAWLDLITATQAPTAQALRNSGL
jgi:SAM-dependent methyltransferase